MNILEIVSIVSSFGLGLTCFVFASKRKINSLLYWLGTTFTFIAFVRILSFFDVVDAEQRLTLVGMAYPVALIGFLVERKLHAR